MEQRTLGKLGDVSALTIGGGGLGQVWGETDRDEAVATLKAAIDGGITLIDMAPMYGRGEAERVVGDAFGGTLPAGVRITTKSQLGSPEPGKILATLELALTRSFDATKLERVDVLILHSNICPDDYLYLKDAEHQDRFVTKWSLYVDQMIPAMETLKSQGRIGDWGITGVGLPRTIMEALRNDAAPAVAQAVTNLMDSAGDMRRYEEPPEPRNIIRTAQNNGVGVMGIRAVQAGALTDAIDRELPADSEDKLDYGRAAPFRALCAKLGEKPAILAHRYALAMEGVDTVVLGVKNRAELKECLDAEAAGALDADVIAQIDALKLNFQVPRMPIDEPN
jgi:aryl-alcohol dehydrogenase-like predicted oxidoreductase